MQESEIKDAATDRAMPSMAGWAPYYDTVVKLMCLGREKELRKKTLALARMVEGERVLEVGCGTGTLTVMAKEIVGHHGRAYGIDALHEMVEAAKKKASKACVDVELRVGLMEDLPFPDNYFDVVLCSFMIFHMSEELRRKGLSQIRRVLKPRGRLLVVDFRRSASLYEKMAKHLLVHSLEANGVEDLVPLVHEKGFGNIACGRMDFPMMGFLLCDAGK